MFLNPRFLSFSTCFEAYSFLISAAEALSVNVVLDEIFILLFVLVFWNMNLLNYFLTGAGFGVIHNLKFL